MWLLPLAWMPEWATQHWNFPSLLYHSRLECHHLICNGILPMLPKCEATWYIEDFSNDEAKDPCDIRRMLQLEIHDFTSLAWMKMSWLGTWFKGSRYRWEPWWGYHQKDTGVHHCFYQGFLFFVDTILLTGIEVGVKWWEASKFWWSSSPLIENMLWSEADIKAQLCCSWK